MTKFTEKEQLIGYVTSISGSLLLVDGALRSASPIPESECVFIDTEAEAVKIPAYAVMQNGQRFILLALDAANPIVSGETVSVEDPVEVPEPTEKEEDIYVDDDLDPQ
jgi:hypothetical protein